MDIQRFQEQISETVIDPMISYMEECGDDCRYTKADVDQCELLLTDYLNALDRLTEPSNDEIMELVKELVLALNDLNEECDYELIETDAREAIWEVIQTGAIECGLETDEDDITAEWREW